MSKTYEAKRTGTKVVTGMVRLSYAHLHEPHAIEGNEPKYSVSLIISKEDKSTIKAVQEAIKEAQEAGKGLWGGKIPGGLKSPLRDGDDERPDDDVYADAYFINANSKRKPEIVDLKGNKGLGPDQVYSGCYGRVSLNFFGYNAAGNKGIGCGLGNVQKIKDGDPLGGATRAEDDFDFEEDEDFLG